MNFTTTSKYSDELKQYIYIYIYIVNKIFIKQKFTPKHQQLKKPRHTLTYNETKKRKKTNIYKYTTTRKCFQRMIIEKIKLRK